ncbi:hypothetical protein [Promicromonospora soli]
MAAFNALGAGLGAIALATGWIDLGTTTTDRLPWGSAVFGGVALALVVALPNAVLTVTALRRDTRTGPLSILAGVVLVGWIVVQLAFIQGMSWLHPFYVAVGLLQVWTGARMVRDRGRGDDAR